MHDFSWRRRRLLQAGSGLLATTSTVFTGCTSINDRDRLDTAIRQLDRLARELRQRSGIPGMAIVVVHRDRILHMQGYGVRRTNHAARVDTDTVFQLASVSKPIAATVMAGLVGDGLVHWDDAVIRHAPEFALADPVATRQATLRDMFCHRSGLPSHAGDLLEDIGYGQDVILFRLRHLPLARPFRSGYGYTNFGLTQAAVAAAHAARQDWEDLARQRLFGPADLKSMSFRYRDFVAKENRAWLHVADENGRYIPKFIRNADAQSPAGGASASIADMARWLRLIINHGKLDGVQHVAAAQLAQTRRPQIESLPAALSPIGRPSFYGLGWNAHTDSHGRLINSHSGGFTLGAATSVVVCVERGLGIAVLTNAWPVGVAESISTTFMEWALDGATSRDWAALYISEFAKGLEADLRGPADNSQPASTVAPARQAQAYTGDFHNPYYGDASIVQNGQALALLLGPQKTAYRLRHWNGDNFVYEPSGENAVRTAGLTFKFGSEGQADRLRIDYLDQNREGEFVRRQVRQS